MINLIIHTEGEPKDIDDDTMQDIEDAFYELGLDVWSIRVIKINDVVDQQNTTEV